MKKNWLFENRIPVRLRSERRGPFDFDGAIPNSDRIFLAHIRAAFGQAIPRAFVCVVGFGIPIDPYDGLGFTILLRIQFGRKPLPALGKRR